MTASSTVAGKAAATAESKKMLNYCDIIARVEMTGVWGEEALELVKEIGRRISSVSCDPQATSFVRQRISAAVQ